MINILSCCFTAFGLCLGPILFVSYFLNEFDECSSLFIFKWCVCFEGIFFVFKISYEDIKLPCHLRFLLHKMPNHTFMQFEAETSEKL